MLSFFNQIVFQKLHRFYVVGFLFYFFIGNLALAESDFSVFLSPLGTYYGFRGGIDYSYNDKSKIGFEYSDVHIGFHAPPGNFFPDVSMKNYVLDQGFRYIYNVNSYENFKSFLITKILHHKSIKNNYYDDFLISTETNFLGLIGGGSETQFLSHWVFKIYGGVGTYLGNPNRKDFEGNNFPLNSIEKYFLFGDLEIAYQF